ncbi:MAG TPA: hypothetical protein VF587_20370 [Solirubrobacteraceae bacterium]|jgi:hypothetical protein
MPAEYAYGSDGNLLPTRLGDGTPVPPVPSLPLVEHLQRKIAPLALEVGEREPERVNLLLPELDPRHAFGGYITKLQLAAALAASGRRVRLVTVDSPARPPHELASLRAYDGLRDVFDQVEVAHRPEAGGLPVSPRDRWIATTWWTAHVAHRATADLGAPPFVYLIQEHESLTFPMGSFAAVAEQSYRLPHRAVFSSATLRDHFAERGAVDDPHVVIENPIVDPGAVARDDLVRVGPPAVLVYARPAATEARNLFELALLGLQAAVAEGAFAGYRFSGVGLPEGHAPIPLGADARLTPVPRQAAGEYRRLLRGHDVGLALMHTPHPSLVPIEMAAAGMTVVTSTFGVKSAERLRGISPNLLGVEPTVESVRDGLRAAAARTADLDARAAGAHVRWSRSAATTFDAGTLAAIDELLS